MLKFNNKVSVLVIYHRPGLWHYIQHTPTGTAAEDVYAKSLSCNLSGRGIFLCHSEHIGKIEILKMELILRGETS